MGQTLPKPALRPFLREDTPVLAAIFAAAIEELTGDDYGESQQRPGPSPPMTRNNSASVWPAN